MTSALDMTVLGDQLLRDRLEALTAAYFGRRDGTSLAHLELRAEALESAQAAADASKAARYLSVLQSSQRLLTLRDVKAWIRALATSARASPRWALENVPTLLFWLLMAGAGLVYYLLNLPLVLLLAAVFVAPLPAGGRCPKSLERAMRRLLPLRVLYPTVFDSRGARLHRPTKSSASASASAASAAAGEASAAAYPAEKQDLSGTWKRFKTENYEEFIGAQGAGFMQRKLAASIALTHTITMSPDLGLFRLQENGGPVCTDWTYRVGSGTDEAKGGLVDGRPNSGPSAPLDAQEDVTVFQKGKEFFDTVWWTQHNVLKVVKSAAPDRKYSLTVHRFLETSDAPQAQAQGGKVIRVQAVYSDGAGKVVKANSWFAYDGPSPHAPPTQPSA